MYIKSCCRRRYCLFHLIKTSVAGSTINKTNNNKKAQNTEVLGSSNQCLFCTCCLVGSSQILICQNNHLYLLESTFPFSTIFENQEMNQFIPKLDLILSLQCRPYTSSRWLK